MDSQKLLFRKFVVHGIVQGVGYRYLVKSMADGQKISGTVRNLVDGSVEIVACGTERDLALFREKIDVDLPHGPSVMQIESVAVPGISLPAEFTIIHP